MADDIRDVIADPQATRQADRPRRGARPARARPPSSASTARSRTSTRWCAAPSRRCPPAGARTRCARWCAPRPSAWCRWHDDDGRMPRASAGAACSEALSAEPRSSPRPMPASDDGRRAVGGRPLACAGATACSPAARSSAGPPRFPLTRPIARRRARELFDLVAGFVYSQVLLACVRLRCSSCWPTGPQTAAALRRRLDLAEPQARAPARRRAWRCDWSSGAAAGATASGRSARRWSATRPSRR